MITAKPQMEGDRLFDAPMGQAIGRSPARGPCEVRAGSNLKSWATQALSFPAVSLFSLELALQGRNCGSL